MVVSTTSIEGYWSFEDTIDSSGNGATLTNNGCSTGETGVIDNCFGFVRSESDNTQATVTLPSGDFTVGGWIKTSASNNFQKLFGIAKSEAGTHGFSGIEQSSGGNWQFFVVNTGNTFYGANGTTSISTGTWYFVVGTYNSTTKEARIFVNGIEEGSVTLSGTIATPTGDIYFGAGFFSGLGNYLDGYIDESFIFNRELSDSEILELYNSGSGLQYPFASLGYSNNINGIANANISKVESVSISNINKINGV